MIAAHVYATDKLKLLVLIAPKGEFPSTYHDNEGRLVHAYTNSEGMCFSVTIKDGAEWDSPPVYLTDESYNVAVLVRHLKTAPYYVINKEEIPAVLTSIVSDIIAERDQEREIREKLISDFKNKNNDK